MEPIKPLLALMLAMAGEVWTLSLPPWEGNAAGPHLSSGWGEPGVRLRHLYTASQRAQGGSLGGSYFLRIRADGRVDGTRDQEPHSLLEMRAVSARAVAIKGVRSSRFLCMEEGGRLRGMLRYSTDDCSFEEEMRPDGYNIYRSKKYGILVSLSNARQRQQFKGKEFLPLSHFLPMINTVPVESADFGEYGDTRHHYESDIFTSRLETDSMDPFGFTSEVSSMQSPSFGK